MNNKTSTFCFVTMNTKVPCPKQRFLFPARQGLRISGKSLGMFFDDLGQKIGKIRYHDFQNRHFCNLGCIFEIKMMMKICLGVFRFQIRILFEKNLWIFFFFNFFFQKVLRFEIWLHLDIFSSSFLFQKCNLGCENVNIENNDILFYLISTYDKRNRGSQSITKTQKHL